MFSTSLSKSRLTDLYYVQGKSLRQIASLTHCSLPAIQRAMNIHGLERRPVGKHSDTKQDFDYRPPHTPEEQYAFGVGMGIYMARGTTSDARCVRLSSGDLGTIEVFLDFLVQFFAVRRDAFRFQIHIPKDFRAEEALDSWSQALSIPQKQFTVVATRSHSFGPGTLTIYYYDKRLRDLLLSLL